MSEVDDDSLISQETAYTDNEEFEVSSRSKQRQFVSGRLRNLKSLDPKMYSEIMVQPILQVRYFMDSI
jgi:hypothetical protein